MEDRSNPLRNCKIKAYEDRHDYPGQFKGRFFSSDITLFEDLGAALTATTTLTEEQRNYKWRKLEQTITLKNQE